MASAGGASKKTSKRSRARKSKKRFNTKTKLIESNVIHDERLSDVIPLLISTTSAVHSFLLSHDVQLLPSQSLSIESLLSSTASSLRHLLSHLSFSIPSAVPPIRELPQSNWFTRFQSSSPDDDPSWVHFFNMSKSSFTLLLRLLTPSLASSLHPSLPNVALAATLFRLAHGASFAAVSRRFSLDSSTACRVFYSVCKAIVENLSNLFEFSSDLNRIIVGFGWMSLPNCCGILGIEKFELEGHSACGTGCLLVQALLDSEGRFLDVSAGWPGSEKPEDVFKKSKLFSGLVHNKEHVHGPAFDLSAGNSIPPYVLGDPCYPLLPWLLTPFNKKNAELNSTEKTFNEVHSRGMKLVGEAFWKVKKRWKLVGTKWKEQCAEAFPFVIVACCLLHNFLIKCSETIPEEENVESCRDLDFPAFEGEEDGTAKKYRDALALHLSG